MPVDEGGLPSQPKAPITVSQYSIDSGNRYSTSLSEALDRAVGKMAKGRV